ncbi:hypothetical protein [Arthrobacter sunyaminii]|nr:hypothetical protein [Arthrobacter sunyaminii]MBO0910109.1 hypothetical protein [Arthrobacter sunyaminii]
MELIGTVKLPDDSTEHLTVQGNTYDDAKKVLDDSIPEGTKLIAIRTNK